MSRLLGRCYVSWWPPKCGRAGASPDELKLIVTASRQLGQIPPLQEEMIHHALELDDEQYAQSWCPVQTFFLCLAI